MLRLIGALAPRKERRNDRQLHRPLRSGLSDCSGLSGDCSGLSSGS